METTKEIETITFNLMKQLSKEAYINSLIGITEV
jgi:hypothetical protein